MRARRGGFPAPALEAAQAEQRRRDHAKILVGQAAHREADIVVDGSVGTDPVLTPHRSAGPPE
ncbi:hypothetical protein GCM10009787_31010 [Streptomyces bangladeshensis]|uniref:Uncharacterized protein n=1 Tax=Streptomyces bangladeshensis TaxID=295352 RepID=A0ABN3BJ33_9ACTN